MWNMSFDGVVSREVAGDGVWINFPKGNTKLCSYKLAFDCTNNMVEYETLVLGLKTLKEMGSKRIVVHGDLLTGETVHPSTGRVEPVWGCLNNPSRLV
jgi:hypothetical protein